ncbi:hypothetical protein QYM36_003877 [Artemia franciscana]|uniref:Anaphase-promoting complex subunit 4-like WD40 domain-containing protein n=1 Tax=Artemia franciscana TaxID=6661 RepID=A0AA88LCY9_ARTSF|nr:hypothetical protein QYM36_003877 [Artemia franciscana]
MGLTKQYLRYVPGSVLNVIASANSNVKFIKYDGQCGRFVAVGACDNVYIWDTRKGEKFFELPGSKHEVSIIESSKNNTLAVGYTDGAIRIFDLKTCECLVTFSGHKREVTSLGFDEKGLRLASGSKGVCLIDVAPILQLSPLDTIGFNMAALEFLQREIEEKEATQLFLDATLKARDKRKKKNRKDLAIKRAVLAL